jgi:hypothetical protein
MPKIKDGLHCKINTLSRRIHNSTGIMETGLTGSAHLKDWGITAPIIYSRMALRYDVNSS